MREGYDIYWGPRDTENWGEADVLAALVDDDVVRACNNDGRVLEFNSAHYTFIRACEVQEPDGRWRKVKLYRDIKYDNIVIWFGSNEWEGINITGKKEGLGSGYRMIESQLFDDQGDIILLRPITSSSPVDQDSTDTNPNPNPNQVPTDHPLDLDDPEYETFVHNMDDVNEMSDIVPIL